MSRININRSIALGLLAGTAFAAGIASTSAQVQVLDNANLVQASRTAQNTSEIMRSNRDIMDHTKRILEAVSGTRSDPQGFANAALGGGFRFGQAPSFSDVLGGGTMQWGQLSGDIQKTASALISGLQLAKSLSGLFEANKKSSNEQAYQSNVNTAGLLASVIAGTQSSQSQRANTFSGFGQQIGQAQDIKGSIDQGTQVSLQHALTTNEMIGVINSLNAAEQAKLIKRLAEESGTADLLRYQPAGGATPPASPTSPTVAGQIPVAGASGGVTGNSVTYQRVATSTQ
ncbi:MAG: type IV secretion system protein [Beijerinckiaceae bacterium]